MAKRITLNEAVIKKIEKVFKEIQDEIRKDFGKGWHAMEITPGILRQNAPDLYKQVKVNELFDIFLETRASEVREYNGEKEAVLNPKFTYYIKKGQKFLILAPSYVSLRRTLTKMSKHPKLLKTDFNRIDIGHTAGFGREDKNTVAGIRIKRALEAGIGDTVLASKIFNRYDKKLSDIHAKYKVDFSKSPSLGKDLQGNLSFVYVVPQDADINRKIIAKFEQRLTTGFIQDLINTYTSPTINEMLLEELEDSFFGRKISTKKYKKVKSGRLDLVKGDVPITNVRLSEPVSDRDTSLSPLRLQKLINLKLHDQIRKNMGKGESRDVLNYRTGRFARSAKAVGVRNTTKNTLDVNYTYMRYPYDTFLPGGRLYKPGRNPKTIIGKSIREIAREFVSNNFKVNPILK